MTVVRIDDPSGEALEQFEKHIRRYFRCAIETAVDSSWKEARRRGFDKMSALTLLRIVNGALKAECARFPP